MFPVSSVGGAGRESSVTSVFQGGSDGGGGGGRYVGRGGKVNVRC